MNSPDTIFHRGLFTTLDRSNPTANAVAIKEGVFTAVGHDNDVMKLAGPSTKVIDLKGRRVLPGLIDNHLHIIRGGLNFNMELRWDGVWSLADAMAMLKKQVAITPPPQWVRVVGGFTEHQFAEKRLPTIDELNAAAPDTPVFILHLYDRAILNAAALRVVGYTRDTPAPPGRRDCARREWQSDRAPPRQAERKHPLCLAGERAQAPVRIPGQFDPSLHA
jgi:predicted amidohydrolase YtcJ